MFISEKILSKFINEWVRKLIKITKEKLFKSFRNIQEISLR